MFARRHIYRRTSIFFQHRSSYVLCVNPQIQIHPVSGLDTNLPSPVASRLVFPTFAGCSHRWLSFVLVIIIDLGLVGFSYYWLSLWKKVELVSPRICRFWCYVLSDPNLLKVRRVKPDGAC